jgi:hypothetical protein
MNLQLLAVRSENVRYFRLEIIATLEREFLLFFLRNILEALFLFIRAVLSVFRFIFRRIIVCRLE